MRKEEDARTALLQAEQRFFMFSRQVLFLGPV